MIDLFDLYDTLKTLQTKSHIEIIPAKTTLFYHVHTSSLRKDVVHTSSLRKDVVSPIAHVLHKPTADNAMIYRISYLVAIVHPQGNKGRRRRKPVARFQTVDQFGTLQTQWFSCKFTCAW